MLVATGPATWHPLQGTVPDVLGAGCSEVGNNGEALRDEGPGWWDPVLQKGIASFSQSKDAHLLCILLGPCPWERPSDLRALPPCQII